MRYLWAVLLVGCGPVDFFGKYSGTLDALTACADGSEGTDTSSVTWSISAAGDEVFFPPTLRLGECGGALKGTARGNVIELPSRTCPTYGDAELMVTETIKSGGTLTLNGDKLSVSVRVFARLRYGSGRIGSCDSGIAGVLTKRAE